MSAGFTANGNLGRGEAEGDDLWRTLTHLNAGDTLFLQSGGDTTLSGATARGHSIIADVGRNLTIESLQDTSTYRSDDWNAGGSVTEQSGLFAGDGGFNVYVGEHTELVGAAIASSDKAAQDGNNQFSTGTLATSDIKNRSSYDASGFSIGGGFSYGGGGMIPLGEGDSGGATGGGVGKDQKGNATTGANADPSTTQPGWNGVSATTPVYMSASDDTRSKTRAGISGADITIRDEEGQKARTGQTAADAIAGLNRDVSSDRDGTSAVDNIYARDKDKIDAGFEITRAFQNEVGNFVVAKAREADAMKKSLIEQGIDPDTSADYLEALKWAPGGAYSQVITAITAATGGNIMDGLDGLAQAAVLNYVQGMGAQKIKKLADRIGEGTPEGEAARAVLQGLAACGAQAGQGGDCVSAGLGTAAGVIVNAILSEKIERPEEMSSEAKKAREDLITSLVAGIAGATGGDAGSAAAGMQVEQENNSLKGKVLKEAFEEAVELCVKNPNCRVSLNTAGLSQNLLLTKEQIEQAQQAGVSQDPARIAKLSPEQIIWLDSQILAGTGIAGLMFGKLTWGDRLNLPTNTGGNQIVESGPTNTGGNQLPEQGISHTGNNNGNVDTGLGHTGGNQTTDQLPTNTGNAEGVTDLPNYMESQGYDPRLPIPEVTTASNGLKVESNSKHTPGALGYRPDAGIEPKDSLKLFEHSVSVSGNKARYSMDKNGAIHRFFPDNMGTYHGSGSTGDIKNPLAIDNKTRAQLRKQEGWKIK